jgi:hypothetical protein
LSFSVVVRASRHAYAWHTRRNVMVLIKRIRDPNRFGEQRYRGPMLTSTISLARAFAAGLLFSLVAPSLAQAPTAAATAARCRQCGIHLRLADDRELQHHVQAACRSEPVRVRGRLRQVSEPAVPDRRYCVQQWIDAAMSGAWKLPPPLRIAGQ